MIAINRHAYDIVSYLISIGEGVNDNRTNISDAGGLIDAIKSRDLQMVAMLVKAGASLRKTYEHTYLKHKRRCRCRIDDYGEYIYFKCVETKYITAYEYAFILEYNDVAEVIRRCSY
jgi:ankyrin repeat protein